MNKWRYLILGLKKVFFETKISYDQKYYIEYLKKKGVSIGQNVLFIDPQTYTIDPVAFFLISIGSNVSIARGLTILCHDYSYSVITRFNGHVFGSAGNVRIGSNVNIGQNVTLLKGADIGNNCIIGANSLVHTKVPSNEVWAGVPARKIMTISEYEKKIALRQISEAKNIVLQFEKKYKRIPTCDEIKTLHYNYLFLDKSLIHKEFFQGYAQRDNPLVNEFLNKYQRPFNNYQEFINYCHSNHETDGQQ